MFVQDVALSVSTPGKLKESLLDSCGNRTRNLVRCGHTQSNITNIYLHLSVQHQNQEFKIIKHLVSKELE